MTYIFVFLSLYLFALLIEIIVMLIIGKMVNRKQSNLSFELDVIESDIRELIRRHDDRDKEIRKLIKQITIFLKAIEKHE